jgi:methylaspartate mutase epsilon subunit
MGFGRVESMRSGLLAVKGARATTVGTITLDSFTRLNDFAGAARAWMNGAELNGYPIVAHGPSVTASMLDGVRDDDFPVQVRHGSARPSAVMRAIVDAGLDATEGGPISYTLPYGKVPVDAAVRDWTAGIGECVRRCPDGFHLETFGGCMLGQLCPPSLLVAVSILEALYFRQLRVRGISLSYAQQTSPVQDRSAVAALRRLASELLPDVDWHVVVYTYMGLFPQTPDGARDLLADSVRLCMATGAERLIVKTPVESWRIPTLSDNVASLEFAAATAESAVPMSDFPDDGTYDEARTLVEATLELSDNLGDALVGAVRRGYLDVPFCLHPDNARRSAAAIGPDGTLRWTDVGRMPIRRPRNALARDEIGSDKLLSMLGYMRRRFDRGPDAHR